MDARLFLRTLGPPALFAPNGDPIRFRVKKHVALLVYLGVEQRAPHRRDHLADFLWPRASTAEGRHSLATAISVLRAKLGRKALETTRDTIRLADGVVAVDLSRLESGAVLADDTRPELEVAAFLDGFDIPDADEFLRWKERKQARLLPSILKAMIVLIDRCRRTADTRTMERLADRMMVLDPLSEDAVRAKMESRAFDGDRLTALRVFEEWKETLARELGAVPSDLVEGIAIRLRRRGWERSVTDKIPSVRTDQWRGRPFIGRRAEYRVLYEGWERTQRGEAGHALVRGDSGIGKTTLVERLSTAAGLEGASVSRVQCYELEREIPYSVVTGLVVGLLDRPGATATAPEALAELGRTVPQVRQRFPTLPPSIESQGETARVRLAEAMLALVLAIAEEHPVILVVDDLHLADDASLAVLHLLIRHGKGQPIMVVLTVRPGELGQSPQAARLLESAAGLGFGAIVVPPMSEDEGVALLDALLASADARPSGAARRALLNSAAGYPMVLELLVQDWQVHGEQSLALSLGAMTADLADLSEEGAYDQIFERITRDLDPLCHNVLNLAAILGPRLNDFDMYGLIDLGIGQTITGLTTLTARRVLRDGGRGLEFTNELVRASAYRRVPSTIRRLLHSQVADRLIEAHKRGPKPQGLETAWHCMRAGRQEEGVPYLLDGASEAILRGAPHEAERAIRTGLPIIPSALKSRAVIPLAAALLEQAAWQELLSALELLPDNPSEDVREEALVLAIKARRDMGVLDIYEIQRDLDTLFHVVGSARRAAIQARAIAVAATLTNFTRQRDQLCVAYRLAQSVPEAELQAHDRAVLACAKAMLAFQLGDSESSLRHLESAASLARSAGLASSVAVSVNLGVGIHACLRGDYENGILHHTSALQAATRLGNDALCAVACGNLAVCFGRLGAPRDQLKWAERALSYQGNRFEGYTELQAALWAGLGYAALDEQSAAVDTMSRVDARMPEAAPESIRSVWALMKADILWALGRQASARTTALQGIISEPPAHFEGRYARWLAAVASSRDELMRAQVQVGRLKSQLSEFDAVDQAEILVADQMIRHGLGRDLDAEGSDLAGALVKLPPTVGAELARFAAMATSWGVSVVSALTSLMPAAQ
jgi:DNA-binding SARP family transcriptional activator/tetratricopeptide (TPR) repeat protein